MTSLTVRAGILALVGAMILAPFFSHPDYSSVTHTLSQLAGQNMPAAWIMRGGFVGLGLAAVAAAWWLGRPESVPLALFGLGMAGVAVWSAAPIDPTLGTDAGEDAVHSVLASVVGAAFAMTCAARLFLPGGSVRDVASWAGLVASVVLPLGMMARPEVAGALQRPMFLIAALWLWRAVP